ncbi:FkbM family methyltransferase [Phenylobacterium sp.]|uniref:FkbM family methyltransferase n=1 Tax=Phenylobacterium sp. TaxID=1871053 RepID=UPI0011FEBEF8|nr:FkbM family methyltransferase [Phenylobacterium sp.]THD62598.1 MAG: FkbM family methyltransferase [Phenylobacterium sp.]
MTAPDTKTLQTRHGPMLALAGDRYVTASLEAYGEFSHVEWMLLGQLVKPGMVVVEAGANIGAHSVALARACAPGPLYLFEPQQRVFQILCANLVLNGITNAVAFPEACGEAEGLVRLPSVDYAAGGNFGGVSVAADVEGPAAPGTRVRVRALDSLDLPACHLIKVDVEGFEAQVIRGAAQTIARFRPVLYLENDRPTGQQELISLVAGLGYDLYWHTPPLFHPENFRGNAVNLFPGVGSVNMLCLPSENGHTVQGPQRIDPQNWTSPVTRTG